MAPTKAVRAAKLCTRLLACAREVKRRGDVRVGLPACPGTHHNSRIALPSPIAAHYSQANVLHDETLHSLAALALEQAPQDRRELGSGRRKVVAPLERRRQFQGTIVLLLHLAV